MSVVTAPDIGKSPQHLAAGSSAYPDNIEREIAARRGDGARAEATANIRVETASTDDDSAMVAEPRRRKGIPLVFLAGGAGAVLVVAVVAIVALRGGKTDDTKPERASASDTSPARVHDLPDTTDSRRTGDTPGTTGSAMRIDEPAKPPSAGSATAEPAPAPTPEPVIEPEAPVPTPPAPPSVAPVAPKKTPTLGGKKVVLEYDNTVAPKEAPKKVAVAKDDSAAIGAARITYFNGNRKLFAGDADSAIKLYKQALAVYPGYVAGYRGLGLAYAQKGDKANALKSFRTYLSAVPGAKDAALVKKRIATLQQR